MPHGIILTTHYYIEQLHLQLVSLDYQGQRRDVRNLSFARIITITAV